MQEISLKVTAEDKGKRLDIFVFQKLNVGAHLCMRPNSISRTIIKQLIQNGEITLNGNIASAHQRVKEEDVVVINLKPKPAFNIEPQNIPIDIVYEDQDIIVVNKQAGLVVHPAAGALDNTLVNALLFLGKELSSVDPKRPGIIHRLDKETSGIMLVAKNNQTHYFLAKQFAKHTIERHYVAVVKGEVEFDEGVIDASIGKHPRDFRKMAVSISTDLKEAKTIYKTLKRTKDWSVLELTPETGRTHQLRVHLASIGHPILGDEKYGRKENYPCLAGRQARLFLHAKSIKFTHPRTKELIGFDSDLPQEFNNFLIKNI